MKQTAQPNHKKKLKAGEILLRVSQKIKTLKEAHRNQQRRIVA